MLTTHAVVSILLAIMLAWAATRDFTHDKQVLMSMVKLGVPESWLTMLGILKAAGALGLLVGLDVPLLGTTAAVGVILFFIGAIITHLRARDRSFGFAMIFLVMAVAVLILDPASFQSIRAWWPSPRL